MVYIRFYDHDGDLVWVEQFNSRIAAELCGYKHGTQAGFEWDMYHFNPMSLKFELLVQRG